MKLLLVGGFLGAGKTTLPAEAARRLAGRGRRVGLVSNDQAPGLVDTALLAGTGSAVAEIAGSCFCCNFAGFVGAVDSFAERGAEIVLAEPAGSCTDLAATLVRPLRRERAGYDLAPLTVSLDAKRVAEALGDAPRGWRSATSRPFCLWALARRSPT